MSTKIKTFLAKPTKNVKVCTALGTVAASMTMFMPMVLAAEDTMANIVENILGVILQVFFYIGILLLAWGVGMLVLAFKNEDADSKSRAMMMLVVAIALIGIKPLLKNVLPDLTAPSWGGA